MTVSLSVMPWAEKNSQQVLEQSFLPSFLHVPFLLNFLQTSFLHWIFMHLIAFFAFSHFLASLHLFSPPLFSASSRSSHDGPGEGSGEGSGEGWHVQVSLGPNGKTVHWHVRPLEGKRLDPQAPRNFGLQILPR